MLDCRICGKSIFKPPGTEEIYAHRIDGKWLILARDDIKQRIDRSFHYPDTYGLKVEEKLKIYE